MTNIYVFSATGTSLQVAKDIAANLDSCRIISIAKEMQKGKWDISAENAGFVFPCYYGDTPQIVKDFITGAGEVKAGYVFAVATAGGNIGYSLKNFDKALHSRNLKLNYGREIIIATSYMPGWYYNMISPSKDKLDANINNAREYCKKIADDVSHRIYEPYTKSYIGYKIPQIISPSRYVNDTRPWDSEFSVSGSCNGCKICESVCPVKNIEFRNEKHHFKGNCQRCMACVQHCPQSAFVIADKPMNKNKYTHPDISVKELSNFNQ